MSYDLFFRRRNAAAAITASEFERHFAGRPHYAAPGQYANQDTGVYFTFDLESRDDADAADEEDARPENDAGVAFNINFYRPHTFALEAAPEVAAFVAAFDLDVHDPQNDGMGDAPYSNEGFLRGWNAGNRFGYSVINAKGSTPLTLPSTEIERCWRWNLGVNELQQQLGEQVFVPRIMFVQRGGPVLTVCAWPDAIAIALPKVDFLAIGRDELAPKRFLRAPKPDMVFVDYATLEPLLAECPVVTPDAHRSYRDLRIVPRALPAHITQLPRSDEKPAGVAVDQILDVELVAGATPVG